MIELLKKGDALSEAYKKAEVSEATIRRRRMDSKDIDKAIVNALEEGKDERKRREKIVREAKKNEKTNGEKVSIRHFQMCKEVAVYVKEQIKSDLSKGTLSFRPRPTPSFFTSGGK